MGFLTDTHPMSRSRPDQIRMRSSAALALVALLPAVLAAQARSPSAPAIVLGLGTDTVEMTVQRQVTGPEQPAFLMITSLSRGSGRDKSALIQSATIDVMREDGELMSRTVDTVVVDAATLRFRRSAVHRYNMNGTSLFDAYATVSDGAVHYRERSDSGVHTSTLALPSGTAAPYASPDLVVRSAPLTPAWTTEFDAYIAGANRMMHVTVDSVRMGSDAGRRVWLLYAHPEHATRLLYTIDSLTRDMTRFDVYDSTGAAIANYRHRRYVHRGSAVTPGPLAVARTSAADIARVAGHYYLEGVREVGSELLLRPNGNFEFMLAYGALDESGEGTWRVADGAVILQSPGAPHPATVKLVASSGVATTSIRVVVNDTQGQPVSGIEVDAVRPKSGTSSAHTRAGQYLLEFGRGDTPTELSVGYDMLNLMVPFQLGRAPKAVYKFVFDRGDLGVRRFEASRAIIEANQLTLTMNGRRMTYVRH